MNIKRYFVIALLALLATPALAEVDLYFEVDGGEVYIFYDCPTDGAWRRCAGMSYSLESDISDAFLFWKVENGRVIFANHKYQFDLPIEDLKVKVKEGTFDEPPHKAAFQSSLG